MHKVLLLSAHYDDAVLSAGQFMAGRPDCDVVTVYGGMPADPDMLTDYDKKCGFINARHAITKRIAENDEALAILGANAINLPFPDSQYGNKSKDTDITTAVEQYFSNPQYEFVLAPLGLDHPDHLTVATIAQNLQKKYPRVKLYLWEDLPMRVLKPEIVDDYLDVNMELTFIGDGPMATKVRSLWFYKSQINTGVLDPYLLYVPERFWEVA